MGTMNDMQVLIEQMVSDISSQAVRLDEVRLQKFLEWLKSCLLYTSDAADE